MCTILSMETVLHVYHFVYGGCITCVPFCLWRPYDMYTIFSVLHVYHSVYGGRITCVPFCPWGRYYMCTILSMEAVISSQCCSNILSILVLDTCDCWVDVVLSFSLFVCMWICACVYVCQCLHVWVCVCLCVCLYVCVVSDAVFYSKILKPCQWLLIKCVYTANCVI